MAVRERTNRCRSRPVENRTCQGNRDRSSVAGVAGLGHAIGMLVRLKHWAKALNRDVVALWIAARDSRTPLLAKFTAGLVAAYGLSPIDLIPDFIPVLGYLDDLLIVPLGVALAVRLIPSLLMAEYRQKAIACIDRPRSVMAGYLIVVVWMIAITATAYWIWLGMH